jgi:CheY-like chemotaxis protein
LHAANGAEALTILDRQSVDAIVSDVLMPVMDGYQLCSAVRQQHRLRGLPFVFYSSHYATDEGEKFGKACGADRYVQKPASTFSILSALYDVVREKREKAPARQASPLSKINARGKLSPANPPGAAASAPQKKSAPRPARPKPSS